MSSPAIRLLSGFYQLSLIAAIAVLFLAFSFFHTASFPITGTFGNS
ncbi:hypothetical protein [Mucilaginibacter gilvus]|nr:hypothetical protein [Mucilaginibacter gilvus]